MLVYVFILLSIRALRSSFLRYFLVGGFEHILLTVWFYPRCKALKLALLTFVWFQPFQFPLMNSSALPYFKCSLPSYQWMCKEETDNIFWAISKTTVIDINAEVVPFVTGNRLDWWTTDLCCISTHLVISPCIPMSPQFGYKGSLRCCVESHAKSREGNVYCSSFLSWKAVILIKHG